MTWRTIGVDLVLRGDPIAQIYDDGQLVGRSIRFRHDDPASLDAFTARILEDLGPEDRVQAILKPTGMSWFPVAHRLTDVGVNVARVKGERVRALRRYLSEHAKTDLADAHVLAAMPAFGGPRLDPLHIPSPKGHALQRLTKRRSRFQDRIAAAKRRLLDLVRWAAPALERVLPDFATCLTLALLRHWIDPDAVLRARRTPLATFIARNASGDPPHGGPFVEAMVEGLRQAARETRALHRDPVDFAELQAELVIEIDVMRAHRQARAELDRKIEALTADLHPQDVLRSIPGVGRHLAPVLLGVLHKADRFRSERHIRGFCGLFPRRSDSGGAERPGRKIAQSGDDRIKRALRLAADIARKIDPDLAEVYCRLMREKGHHHKQALCAVATASSAS